MESDKWCVLVKRYEVVYSFHSCTIDFGFDSEDKTKISSWFWEAAQAVDCMGEAGWCKKKYVSELKGHWCHTNHEEISVLLEDKTFHLEYFRNFSQTLSSLSTICVEKNASKSECSQWNKHSFVSHQWYLHFLRSLNFRINKIRVVNCSTRCMLRIAIGQWPLYWKR